MIHVVGEVDLRTATSLETELTKHLTGETPARVVANLTSVSFLGSSGLAVLVRFATEARDRGVRLNLAVSHPVRRPLEVTRTDHLFSIYDSVESALAAG